MAAVSDPHTSLLVLSDHQQDDRVGAASAGEPFKHETAGELRSGKEAAELVGQHAHAGGDFIRGCRMAGKISDDTSLTRALKSVAR